MRQGTTPPHSFKLPVNADRVVVARITYEQDDRTVLEKGLEDCAKSGQTLTLNLTQEETFLFDGDKYAKVQVRILTDEGKAFASNVDSFYVGRTINREVLK